MVGAPACGDVMKLQIRVNDHGVIEDAKFKTYGCGSAIASSSLVTEWVKGKTLDQALEIKNSQIAQELSLPPVKIHCSILAEDAIKAAVLTLLVELATPLTPLHLKEIMEEMEHLVHQDLVELEVVEQLPWVVMQVILLAE